MIKWINEEAIRRLEKWEQGNKEEKILEPCGNGVIESAGYVDAETTYVGSVGCEDGINGAEWKVDWSDYVGLIGCI